jgi:membrane protease YdiL (CAAX protease family)
MDEPDDPLRSDSAPSELASEDSRNPQLPWAFHGPNGLRAGWRLLVFLAILSAAFAAAALVARLTAHRRMALRDGMTPEAMILGEGFSFFFVLLASWIMARIEGRSIADYGLPPSRAFGIHFWAGAAVGFASISALLGILRLAGAFHVTGLALHGVEIWKYGAIWGTAFVIVGLFEELFFRGYCLFTLTMGIGFWPAAFASSFVFGYVHRGNSGETWVGAFAAGLVGLLFALLLRGTGDLWMPIGFHAAWDWGETYFYGVSMRVSQVRNGSPVERWDRKEAGSVSC